MLVVIAASQQTNRTNMSGDSSIVINRSGKKRRRVQDEGDVSMRSGEQNKLFHDLRSYFDSKFSEARKENERLAKKIRTDTHELKYRGNQLQLDFNDSIIAQLESNTHHIKNNLTKKSLKGIKKAIADLKTRNEMIKIADKSPGGQKTVEEYLSDSIASDSDDERKLRAAESRALRKKQNSRKPYHYNNIYSATPSATFNHRFRNVQQIQFPTQHSFSPPIINASRRTSSHTLTVATTKAPLSPLVDQISQQPALRTGELDTREATAPMEEISEDEAESFDSLFYT